ncbi:prophage DNA methylase [Citrobacter koseri]|nr:prophage DNA methylase [Citrobacter koseri]
MNNVARVSDVPAFDLLQDTPPTDILYPGDCLDVLRSMADNSVDSIVTDPPYGLSFMGKKWDYDVPSPAVWAECLRVLKPGGHLLAFAGTRTQHRMAVCIEDAGFEIRDMIAWVYGSGFPKSHNLRGALEGRGTALKPALEPVTVARKWFRGAVVANVLTHGTGALNIDRCRVGTEGSRTNSSQPRAERNGFVKGFVEGTETVIRDQGRWPANLIHDGSDEVVSILPGNSARFFYCAKASRKDRNEGLEGIPSPQQNHHPTVKPTDLMRYLCRLVTPPGGTVLDPFMGSGSTGKAAVLEGFRFIGIEREPEYIEIARQRIAAARRQCPPHA